MTSPRIPPFEVFVDLHRRFHWPALVSGLMTLLGALASPPVLGVLPGKVSAGLIIAGSIAQAFTKPLPKDAPAS